MHENEQSDNLLKLNFCRSSPSNIVKPRQFRSLQAFFTQNYLSLTFSYKKPSISTNRNTDWRKNRKAHEGCYICAVSSDLDFRTKVRDNVLRSLQKFWSVSGDLNRRLQSVDIRWLFPVIVDGWIPVRIVDSCQILDGCVSIRSIEVPPPSLPLIWISITRRKNGT